MKSYPILNCRLCGSDLLQQILAFEDTPAGDLYKSEQSESHTLSSYPLRCNMCVDCGHVQLSYFVDPSEIYSEYIYKTSDSLGLAAHFESFSQDLANYSSPNKRINIFEIGCNDGTLLHYLQELGHETLGMDPAAIPVREAQDKGLNVVESYFDKSMVAKVKKLMPNIDVIIANNVIANVEDLNSVFDGFVELLTDNGFIVFETGYLRYLVDLKVVDNVHHEHIDYFAITPLTKFFESKGLYIDRVLINDSKGSSIRVFVRRGKSELTPKEVREICSQEASDGYFTKSTYDQLLIDIAQERKRLLEFIVKSKNIGLCVVGYGAAIGTTTLLSTFQLCKDIDFLIDDNPRRIGKFAPGSGIEVKSPDQIQGMRCAVIIFAWRYQDAIKARISLAYEIEAMTSIWSHE